METVLTEATQIHKEVQKKAKSTVKREMKFKHVALHHFVRQGDIYLVAIKKVTGTVEIKDRQLAPGTTKGSRHMVSDAVKLYAGFDPSPFTGEVPEYCIGPQILATNDFCVLHPEHANCVLPPGAYQVTYQADFARQNRVRD